MKLGFFCIDALALLCDVFSYKSCTRSLVIIIKGFAFFEKAKINVVNSAAFKYFKDINRNERIRKYNSDV